MRTLSALVSVALLVSASPIQAQDRKGAGDTAIYQVQFNIRDGRDPSAKTGRSYSMLVAANRKAVFQVGERVPVSTSSSQPGATGGTQFTYLDIGVNIECIVADAGGKLAMHGAINLTERHDAKPGAANPNPIIGQTRLDLDTAVEPGKPTVVASLDDPVDMRSLRVEATVTKVN
jgi:hypothetical protein